MRPLDPRLLRHAAAARPFVLVCALLGLVTAGLVTAQADLLAGVIADAFLGRAGLAALTVPIGLIAAVVLARAAVAWLAESAAHRASATVLGQLRAAVVDKALALGHRRHTDRSPAELATLATRGVDRLDGYFARYLPQLLIAAIVPAVIAGRILLADWVAALIVGLTIPLIPLFMILIGRYTQRGVRRQWRTLSLLGNHFVDLVAGLAVLTAFGRAKAQRAALAEITRTYRRQTMRTLRVAFLSALVLELLATLSVAVVAVSIGLRLVAGGIDLHTALVVLILAPEVYLPLRAVGARFHDSAEGVAAAEEILALLDEPDTAAGTRVPAPDPSRSPLRLCEVTVTGRSAPVLDRFSLTVAPGEVLGVTGPSGAGKSTLLDLLLGWYPPDSGHVYVDGVDLASVDRDAWQSRIAWVPQRPRLVTGTVADNIRLGAPTASDERVEAAAKAAALDVPLSTPVGELGAGLSTGQRRRVALARAVLADRPLLVLDEPTEGVDDETEQAILDRLPPLLTDRTVVLVTHRERLLSLCDRVVRLAGRPVPASAVPPGRAAAAPVARPAPSAVVTDGTAPERARSTWRWLRTAVRPHRTRVALACLAGAAALASGVALTATSAWLISSAALHPPVLTLMVAIVAVRTFGLAKGVLRYTERLLSHDVALRALADLRVRVWTTLVRLGPAVTARHRRGDLLDRLVSDVDNQQDVLVRGVVPVLSATLVAAGTALGIGMLLPSAGLAVAIGLTTAGAVAPLLSLTAARKSEHRTTALRAGVATGTVELLTAAPDLLAFGAATPRHAILRAADDELTSTRRRGTLARGAGIAVGTLSLGLTTVACLVLGIAALRSGALPGPELAVLALTPLAAAELVAGLPDAATRLLGATHSARRLAELDATPTPTTDPTTPAPLPTATTLTTTDVSVRWPNTPHDAVTGVNLHLDERRAALLTGPSGAGKSTLLAALMRDLDPSAGNITIDGTDTRTVPADDIRTRIAWCGPETHLFDSTLRQNLLLANPSATDADLTEALTTASLGPWLQALPDGLDTALGAHGTDVSGGERQRLGVARTLLADRPLLLLDEPTAHLDHETAAALAADLRTLAEARTALIVTHHPTEFPGLPVYSLRPPGRRGQSSEPSAARPLATQTRE
ncbi:thiol reductant ABC exporter subunit CydD [Actinophytocola oryzae]|uniref:ATP-binding cassette subfamily C protein CydCD n=1 Tax=Actinophytocola oryzae TaxID=502181 RepID=A0A4R7V7J1_9PSEU|nr:thiol reductant ABC exporter subunit CydD [Actinophytocola oryzae]TDV44115.1 ATP-binding cassette subfamily C protein CydCD [Actinophytocola oryzae]